MTNARKIDRTDYIEGRTDEDPDPSPARGCLNAMVLTALGGLAVAALWAGIAFGLGGCTTVVAAATRNASYEAVWVTGTAYAAVYRDGLPLAPGSYRINVVSPTQAEVIMPNSPTGRVVGLARLTTVPGKPGSTRIEIQPGGNSVIIKP